MGDVYDRLWRVLETVEGPEKGVMSYVLPVPGLVLDGWAELEGNEQLEEMKERLKIKTSECRGCKSFSERG